MSTNQTASEDGGLYQKLDTAQRQIRTVQLLPGDRADPIKCRLLTECLNHWPDYEALSYVWLLVNSYNSITVNGQPLQVTGSLYDALKALRYPDKTRTLWIDAICINQSDLRERSEQVSLMGSIYKEARRVLIWLGETEFGSYLYMEIARRYGGVGESQEARQEHQRVGIRDLDKRFAVAQDLPVVQGKKQQWTLCKHIFKEIILYAASHIFTRPWWQRIWTVQELLLAREAEFIWGDMSISWLQLRLYFYQHALGSYDAGQKQLSTRLGTPSNFASLHARVLVGKRTSLAQIMRCFRFHIGTDPKDYVYAFMALSSDFRDFEVDYEKPVAATYIDFANKCIAQRIDLSILSMSSYRKDKKIPSWMPDETHFVNKAGASHLCGSNIDSELFTAVLNSAPEANLFGSILEANGWMIGYVEGCGQQAEEEETTDYMALLADWEKVIIRKYGDAGCCSRERCSSQKFYENATAEPDLDTEECQMSVCCVLDHWQRRMKSAHRAWRDRPDNDLGDQSRIPKLADGELTAIEQSREVRLAQITTTTSWRRDKYYFTNDGIGEAYARTLLADTFRIWKGEGRVNDVIEASKARAGLRGSLLTPHLTLAPSKNRSYPNFLAALADSYVPEWDFHAEHTNPEELCPLCARYETRQDNVAQNYFLFVQSLKAAVATRRLITTNNGLMGLAPGSCQIGDIVVLLRGLDTPLILRQVDQGQYVSIGESYIHGIMDGFFFQTVDGQVTEKFEAMKDWRRKFKIR